MGFGKSEPAASQPRSLSSGFFSRLAERSAHRRRIRLRPNGYNPRPFTFVAGQTVRVRLKFVNSQGEDLDIVESEHCAGLTFDPGSLATATRLFTNHYQLDVTGQAPGSGTLQVSFGHDELADEHTFPEGAVTVTP